MIKTTLSHKDTLHGLHYTTSHQGKMTGVHSLSTSCLANELCQKRRKVAGTICAKCYAHTLISFRPSTVPNLKQNTQILGSGLIPAEDIPVIASRIFRFESFGDTNNWVQVANYFHIAAANPDVPCAVWTKNPWHYADAINRGFEKPDNLVILYSSPIVGKCRESVLKLYPFVDKVFTVYKDIEGININCGNSHCLVCQRCYHKNTDKFINEKIK